VALKLDILANTRQFVSDMQKAGASVEDISDALNDLIRDGDKAGDKLEHSFREAARQVKKFSDETEKAGKSAGTDLTKGFKKAEGGVEDFKQEANSSLRETAASISSVEDGLGAVQEIAANAFVGFGPVGAGAGLVAALGFGLLLENLNKQNEAIQRMKEYFAEAYQTAAAEGRKYLDTATILNEAQEILFNPDRQGEYNQALEQSKRIGVDINTLILARAGDQDALTEAIAATQAAQESLDTTVQGAGRFSHEKNNTEKNELEAIQRQYQAIGKLHQDNAQRAQAAQQIENQLHAEDRRQLEQTANAHRAAQDRIRSDASRPITIPLRADTSQLSNAIRRYVPPPIYAKVIGVDSRGRILY
jgi:hypothetical protein